MEKKDMKELNLLTAIEQIVEKAKDSQLSKGFYRKAFPEAENHQLHTISELCGYHLENHHHALADAEACAWIAREIL